MINNTSRLPDPPNVIKAIRSGFDAITNHIGLVGFPVCLDVLLWFAPHLRIKGQIERLLSEMNSISSLLSADFQEMIQVSQGIWTEAAGRINLLAALRSYPVGVFSLMTSILPIEHPLGRPLFVEIQRPQTALLIAAGFFVIGVGLGGLYFGAVRQAALYDLIQWRTLIPQCPRFTAQSLLLSGIFFVFFLGLLILGSCAATGVALISITMGQAVVLLFGVMAFWLIFPLFFSPHGIFIKNLTAGRSLLNSLQLTSLTFFRTGFFIMIALLVTQGLTLLWQVSPEDSWLMVISILGHGFVSTGMLAASFVYYQDMNRWVNELRTIRKAEFACEDKNGNNNS